jgi:hypothetical protein
VLYQARATVYDVPDKTISVCHKSIHKFIGTSGVCTVDIQQDRVVISNNVVTVTLPSSHADTSGYTRTEQSVTPFPHSVLAAGNKLAPAKIISSIFKRDPVVTVCSDCVILTSPVFCVQIQIPTHSFPHVSLPLNLWSHCCSFRPINYTIVDGVLELHKENELLALGTYTGTATKLSLPNERPALFASSKLLQDLLSVYRILGQCILEVSPFGVKIQSEGINISLPVSGLPMVSLPLEFLILAFQLTGDTVHIAKEKNKLWVCDKTTVILMSVTD